MRINFSDKKIKVFLHVVMWIAILSLPFILYKSEHRPPANPPSEAERVSFLYFSILTDFFWVIVFYLNGCYLMPRLFSAKKWATYIVSIIAVFCAAIGAHYVCFRIFIADHTYSILRAITYALPPYILALAASALWHIWQEKSTEEALLQQQKEENLKTELSFLRSQISPHFIFNILNNITALIRMKSDQAEPTIIQLSSLMQYMLYDINQERVLLKTEVEYLMTYIELQQQRFGSRVKVETEISLENDWAEIEPMLLIPFVENAFKHGAGYIKNPFIHLILKTRSNRLFFEITNKYNPASTEIKDKTSGIGLSNVQRRIELLYKDKSALIIHKSDQEFNVNLELELHTQTD